MLSFLNVNQEAPDDAGVSKSQQANGEVVTDQQATDFQDIIAELAAKSRPALQASSSSSSDLSLGTSSSKSAGSRALDADRKPGKAGLQPSPEQPDPWRCTEEQCCDIDSQPYSRMSDCSSLTQVSNMNNHSGSSFSVSDSESDMSLSGSSSVKGVANKVKFFNARQRVLASFKKTDDDSNVKPRGHSNGSVLQEGRVGNGEQYELGKSSPADNTSVTFSAQMNIKENPSARFEEESIDSIKEHISQYSQQMEPNHMVTMETHKLYMDGSHVKRLETRIENRVLSSNSNSGCSTPKFTDSKTVLENYESLKWVCN